MSSNITLNNTVPTSTDTHTAPVTRKAAAPAAQTKAALIDVTSPFGGAPAQAQTRAQAAYHSDGFSAVEAFNILGKAAMTNQQLAARIHKGAQKNELGAKQQGLQATKDKIHGEQASAGLKAVGAVAASSVQGTMAYKGAKLLAGNPKGADGKPKYTAEQALARSVKGSMLEASSKGINDPINQTIGIMDKFGGGQAQADQAQIREKQADVDAQIARNTVETSKSAMDAATEGVKTANNGFMDHVRRVSDFISKIGA